MPFIYPLQEAQAHFPQYRFIDPLTPSAQKAAFHVVDTQERHLCLKLIEPNSKIDRLQRELKALIEVDHPNVVRFLEYNFKVTKNTNLHYIVEEYVPGFDLESDLGPEKIWTTQRAAQFFALLFEGLAELKRCNLVHRDLKPTNVRVHINGYPVIIDLGLARHLELPDLTHTSAGAAIGSPAYFAPEQFRGTRHDIDHRTDLFPAGVLLYYALLGRHPFMDGSKDFGELEQMVCESNQHFERTDFLALPGPWQILIRKLLERRRNLRPGDAGIVAKMIRQNFLKNERI